MSCPLCKTNIYIDEDNFMRIKKKVMHASGRA